jgi:Domain of unknown function (DUF4193)
LDEEEEFLGDEEEEFPDELPEGELAEDATEEAPAEAADATEDVGDESIEDILATRPEERVVATEEEEEESLLSLDREEHIETLSTRVIPKQESEFVCQRCHLVKPIRSQLADRKRMLCRDCA